MSEKATILIAILGSTGFWAVAQLIVSSLIERRRAKREKANITREEFEVVQKALRGLLYGELEKRCTAFIHDGHISAGELNDLRKYYYEPYKGLNGDGTIDALFQRCVDLDIEE